MCLIDITARSSGAPGPCQDALEATVPWTYQWALVRTA